MLFEPSELGCSIALTLQQLLLEGTYDPVTEYRRLFAEAAGELVADKMDNHEKVQESTEACWVCGFWWLMPCKGNRGRRP